MVFGVLFTIVGFIVSVINMDFFIPKNQAHLRDVGIQVSLMVWIGSGFTIMSGYLSSILNYNKQFFKVAWTSLLPASFMIIIVLLFHKIWECVVFHLGFVLHLYSNSLFF